MNRQLNCLTCPVTPPCDKGIQDLTIYGKYDKINVLFVPGCPPRLRKEGGSVLDGEGS